MLACPHLRTAAAASPSHPRTFARARAGYFNYIRFQECLAPAAARVPAGILLVVWMLFLLHCVESTTNEYFVTSLQLAVAILHLSPNVAGVTFLAVGNAACDVIASIAAFATGVPKVGVGTTLGAGIFVTTAVVAAVSFVSDVRLARRSFVRDVVFFIATVLYLLGCTLDGVITFNESVGFIAIYFIFVAAVGGGRWFSMLREAREDEALAAGSGGGGGGEKARRQSVADVAASHAYKAPNSFSIGAAAAPADMIEKDLKALASGPVRGAAAAVGAPLAALALAAEEEEGGEGASSSSPAGASAAAAGRRAIEAAYRESIRRQMGSELLALRSDRIFAPEAEGEREENGEDEGEDARGGGGGGGGGGSPRSGGATRPSTRSALVLGPGQSLALPSTRSGLAARRANAPMSRARARSRSGTGTFSLGALAPDDLPRKPSRWTEAFYNAVDGATKDLDDDNDGGSASSSGAGGSGGASARAGPGGGGGGGGGLGGGGGGGYGTVGSSSGGGGGSSGGGGIYGSARAFSSSGSSSALASLAGQLGGLGGGGAGSGGAAAAPAPAPRAKEYLPFQMPTYHRKKLAQQLAARLAARGLASEVVTPDGKTVNVAELALEDIEAAAQTMAAFVTAEAMARGGAKLTFAAAMEAAALGARAAGDVSGGGGGGGESSALARGRAVSDAAVAIKPEDLLAVLPRESIKPISKTYLVIRDAFAGVGPYYHAFMCAFEVPVTVARTLTIPLLHEGTYRRRMTAVTLPFSLALLTVVMTTHVLEGVPTEVRGGPIFALAFDAGAALALPLYFGLLPRAAPGAGGDAAPRKGSGTGLLDRSGAPNPGGHGGGHGGEEGDEDARWYDAYLDPVLLVIMGEEGDPMPTGVVFTLLLMLSFLMSLVWLLLIANEIVGVALFFGKVLAIPDTVMGLVVLAIGNSINDLAASVTIAREGFPSMAVAGAFAGPMFNVLAGIGLPMLIYTASAESGTYAIGKNTPIVWAAFAALLTSLVATLVAVPLAGFRITHQIGRGLLFWFFAFIALVIVMALTVSEDDAGIVLE